jgi:hypothetical protein
MTHVSCPLCGKLSHASSFHPENLGNDIEYVDMRSLGRGRGFQVTGRYTALGDPVLMGRISLRLHVLLRLIEGKEPLLNEENQRLLDAVEELEDEDRSLSEKLKKANQMIIKYEDTAEEEEDGYEELFSLVNNALSDVYDEEFDDLNSAVRTLIDEYDDLLEETEDEG